MKRNWFAKSQKVVAGGSYFFLPFFTFFFLGHFVLECKLTTNRLLTAREIVRDNSKEEIRVLNGILGPLSRRPGRIQGAVLGAHRAYGKPGQDLFDHVDACRTRLVVRNVYQRRLSALQPVPLAAAIGQCRRRGPVVQLRRRMVSAVVLTSSTAANCGGLLQPCLLTAA